MTDFLVNNANPKTRKLLMKCLETAGFEVINTENTLISVQLAQEKLSTTDETKKSNTSQSILPSIPRLHKVFSFIELNYHEHISLKEVAEAVGYSPAYLTDLVRRLSGKTINDWIIERRITQACHLLLETNYSVNRIALEIGYKNVNHFYCQFRDRRSISPQIWKKHNIGKILTKYYKL